ncbi:hypothetical protein EB796_015222 [Bugula neritina]|uniref:Uncharacterized protein n=1 Tax=Bugula neritina TaxID=10212 RepID=A0A7J7JLE3_BUGNE|nr:hypothetical protein EB796_015222 [Bugula neritina]
MPGLFQTSKDNRFNPETGDYYWINEPHTKITNESSSYWQPFDFVITKFNEQSLYIRQRSTFVLRGSGSWLPGGNVGDRPESVTPFSGIVCRGILPQSLVNGGRCASYQILLMLAAFSTLVLVFE